LYPLISLVPSQKWEGSLVTGILEQISERIAKISLLSSDNKIFKIHDLKTFGCYTSYAQ